MLIEPAATPKYGSIDFFAESVLQELDDGFIIDSVGASWLGGGRGRIDVVPSFGALSIAHPRNVLAKLSRAYLETERGGAQRTFLSQTQNFVQRLTALRRYDAVLVDSRAGLHETTPASLLGLGADVLLFGVNQAQTILGYRVLISHLAQLPVIGGDYDWRYRLRMVQAKAETSEVVVEYRNRVFDVFDDVFYARANEGEEHPESAFRFGIDDPDAPHFPIAVYEDERYRTFDPVQNKSQLDRAIYEASFGEFARFCIERLQLEEDVG
jgi:hypothetical protein